MKSLEWTLIQYYWCLYKKGKFKHIHTGRMPCEREGRDQGERRTPSIASGPPGRDMELIDITALRSYHQPCQHLDLGLQTLELVDNKYRLLSSVPVCGTLLRQPWHTVAILLRESEGARK